LEEFDGNVQTQYQTLTNLEATAALQGDTIDLHLIRISELFNAIQSSLKLDGKHLEDASLAQSNPTDVIYKSGGIPYKVKSLNDYVLLDITLMVISKSSSVCSRSIC
jgi:hypothetical protein